MHLLVHIFVSVLRPLSNPRWPYHTSPWHEYSKAGRCTDESAKSIFDHRFAYSRPIRASRDTGIEITYPGNRHLYDSWCLSIMDPGNNRCPRDSPEMETLARRWDMFSGLVYPQNMCTRWRPLIDILQGTGRVSMNKPWDANAKDGVPLTVERATFPSRTFVVTWKKSMIRRLDSKSNIEFTISVNQQWHVGREMLVVWRTIR